MAALCTLAYSAISFPGAKLRRKFSWRETLGIAKYPGVLLLAFVLFFESGNEASIAGWTSTYSNTMGFSPRMASLVLASYWATLMLSRVLVAAVLPSIGKAQLLVAAALMSLAGCAILLSASSLVLLFAGTSLIGLACGPIYPTTLAIAGDRYSNTGTVFGLLFSIALLGRMTFPWVIGQVSTRDCRHLHSGRTSNIS